MSALALVAVGVLVSAYFVPILIGVDVGFAKGARYDSCFFHWLVPLVADGASVPARLVDLSAGFD